MGLLFPIPKSGSLQISPVVPVLLELQCVDIIITFLFSLAKVSGPNLAFAHAGTQELNLPDCLCLGSVSLSGTLSFPY